MRWLIGILLLLNFSFFLWSNFESPEGRLSTGLPEPDVGSLRLLNEMRMSAEPPKQPINTPLLAMEESLSEQNAVEPSLPQGVSKMPATTSAQVVAKALPLKNPVIHYNCIQGGNFERKEQAEAVAGRIPSGVELVGVEPMMLETISGYYVMIPAAKTFAEAKKTVAELKKKGIHDTWLFASGRYKHAISLGLFSRKANAGQLAKKTQSKGFNAVVEQKMKGHERYRVLLRAEDDDFLKKTAEKLGLLDTQKVICPLE